MQAKGLAMDSASYTALVEAERQAFRYLSKGKALNAIEI